MATMSIGKAWEEAVVFVRREASLLFPVALLFVALPGLIVQEMTPRELVTWYAAPRMETIPDVPASFSLAMLIGVILIWFGSLTLFALALRPGISVGEALRLGLRRLPVLLGTALAVVGIIAMLAIAILIVALTLSGVSKAAGASLGLILGFFAAMLGVYASVRLMLLNAVVIDGDSGVIASLRAAWALTRGHVWRLFGFILIVMIISAIVGGAAQAIFGVIGGLLGGAEAARIAGGIGGAAASVVIQVYMLVMLARLYRQAAG